MEVDERKDPCDVVYVMRDFLDNKTSKNEADGGCEKQRFGRADIQNDVYLYGFWHL